MAAKRKYSAFYLSQLNPFIPTIQKKRKIQNNAINKRPNMDPEDKDRWDELCESIDEALHGSLITDIVEAIADMANGFWCECSGIKDGNGEDCNEKISCTNGECLDPDYKTCLECGTSQWLIKCSLCDEFGTLYGHCSNCRADYCRSCVGNCDEHHEKELCDECVDTCYICAVNYCHGCECDCEPL